MATAKISAKKKKDADKHVKDRHSCREVFRNKKMHVVEYLPQVRLCKFNLHGENSAYSLAMPYMQFTRYVGLNGLSLHVSFTNEPLQSIKQDVYFPPLPNVWWPSLQVCLMTCPGPNFDQVMTNFWNTRYLDCEDWYCFPVLDKELPMRTYKVWERMTKEDPSFVLGVNWTHPTRIEAIPDYDQGGKLVNNRQKSANPEYGGSETNRLDGPIRSFAVVKCDVNSLVLD